MATTIVVCPECGAGLPYGRLSCTECGALLASVAGSVRAMRPALMPAPVDHPDPIAAVGPPEAVASEAVAPEDVAPEAVAAAAVSPAADRSLSVDSALEPTVDAEPGAALQAAAGEPAAGVAAAGVAAEPDPTPAPEPVAPALPDWKGPLPDDLVDIDEDQPLAAFATAQVRPLDPTLAATGPARDTGQAPNASATEPDQDPSGAGAAPGGRGAPVAGATNPALPTLPDWPAAAPGAAAFFATPAWAVQLERLGGQPDLDAPARHLAGAYLPPSAMFTPAPQPEPASAVARPTPGFPASGRSISDGKSATSGETPTASVEAPLDGAFVRPTTVAGWVSAVGAVVAAVAFVLPWSAQGVIGAQGDPGYLGRWGLANPAYLLVALAALGVLGLQIVRNPLPGWIRSGVIALGAGGLLLGLSWTYAAGPFGIGPGVTACALGGAILFAAGVIERRELRHDDPRPSV